jgi:hypothetical protein
MYNWIFESIYDFVVEGIECIVDFIISIYNWIKESIEGIIGT